jgi:(2R)-3-sulfolactate dehydrogenase (NADP+)
LTGAQFGFEASSFFVDEGNAPRLGQAFIVIDPAALGGSDLYFERMECIIAEMLVDEGVRLAGERRLVLERMAREEGLELPDSLIAQLQDLSSPT